MREQMRKKNILNLIKYYAEHNDAGFRNEAYIIAKLFDQAGDSQLAEYIMALLSGANTFVPQSNEYQSSFFNKVSLTGDSLPLPTSIMNDIIGVINSIRHHSGFNKFLFEGDPGTGKTETVKQIARILNRDLYSVDFDSVIDSKLGQTSKNIASVFQEIRALPNPEKAIIMFDEIDAIALDRINSNDLREMGRVTSSVLKGLDGLDGSIVLIATTNLFAQFDKALTRRFDAIINFNRYNKNELLDIAESILNDLLIQFKFAGRNMRLFRKIISTMDKIPYPGELKNIIKTSVAFSDPTNEYAYLKKLYETVSGPSDIKTLQNQGFSVREIEILTSISKSQVARELQG
ncbi:ATP-binding protein [Candidatus Nanosynbacter sp. HMT-352]|jgi:AAA ATPase|uniref:ATP-binding protein n=2 Tax=unclassified Candidatus Nanosynbacter TaxID=2725944 RepID=UPI001FB5F96A|nr:MULTISPECIES: ATP-binding protein [unclassified Candidatus Nanosynbacter]MCJ1963596.1 ATP-binding protein [Candidatus Nanosynbacter sp. TM7-033]UOG68081.1 ATP-binding protein [Candidatus Nanosynbacter sp. HMT-352]